MLKLANERSLVIKNWVQDWVQVATLETGSRLVSCAGSTKGLTATNQEVAGSSPAGRAKSLRKINHFDSRRPELSSPTDK